MNTAEKRVAALARQFVRLERLYNENRDEYLRRFHAGDAARLHTRLVGHVGGTSMVADLVLREARDYYRQRIRLDCGHVHVFYVSSRQLTGNTHPCAYDLLFVPQAYWETGPMYCNRCDGRPERTVTGVEIESHRMVCEEIMLTCGHTLKQMHRASQSPLSLDGGFERPCTGCLGRPRGGVSIRTLSAG